MSELFRNFLVLCKIFKIQHATNASSNGKQVFHVEEREIEIWKPFCGKASFKEKQKDKIEAIIENKSILRKNYKR